jgi:hypothetical protein
MLVPFKKESAYLMPEKRMFILYLREKFFNLEYKITIIS